MDDYERCAAYDISVVDGWIKYLNKYTSQSSDIRDKEVLELGPGADLGIGLYLLSKGVKKYNAIDVNGLAADTPIQFYEHLLKKLGQKQLSADLKCLKQLLSDFNRLNYVCRQDFSLTSSFLENSIDIIFSQAALEHFDDIENTIKQLSIVSKPGAILTALIDLKTHSRWIRDKDPNNIYRYSPAFYRLFRFRGIPNRLRPYHYEDIFIKYGWGNIQIFPIDTLSEDEYKKMRPFLFRDFYDDKNQMQYLSIILCATNQK
ncbi:MAG: methyltransferase domain-containing protein [Candidatus Aureabacteria bacterium]|nr:methyltransferase domain-containing protein [Candidatus Auribacterota bacterium]